MGNLGKSLIPKTKFIKSIHEELHMPAKKRRTRSTSLTATIGRSLATKKQYNKTGGVKK
jgi:hypothetical protein